MTDSIDFDDDDSIRIARRQWMNPDKKEKVMGRLKQMLLDPRSLNLDRILTNLTQLPLIGFGEASFIDMENYLGFPDIHPDTFPEGCGIFNRDGKGWTVRCAWGVGWEDGHSVIIHDRDSAVKEVEDIKHWHVTGSRDAWGRLMDGYVVDPISVRLEKAR